MIFWCNYDQFRSQAHRVRYLDARASFSRQILRSEAIMELRNLQTDEMRYGWACFPARDSSRRQKPKWPPWLDGESTSKTRISRAFSREFTRDSRWISLPQLLLPERQNAGNEVRSGCCSTNYFDIRLIVYNCTHGGYRYGIVMWKLRDQTARCSHSLKVSL